MNCCCRLLALVAAFAIANSSTFAQCNRATIVADYNTNYIGSNTTTTEIAWSGATATCTPATISKTAQTRTLQRINYFRHLVGLPNNVRLDSTLAPQCQQAALMMTANGQLNHNPPASWTCYSSGGATAASKSNLSLGVAAADAVSSYMYDNGTTNAAAGHRRWILYSRALVFGHGATSTADALWVIGTTLAPAPTITYIAYPPAGFVPATLIPQRWSIGVPSATFTNSSVYMKDDAGQNVTLTKETIANGYGDNTLVWTPQNIITNSPYDKTYTVTVTGVAVGALTKSYTYDVTIIQPTHPPACPAPLVWSETQCKCAAATATNNSWDDAENAPRISLYPNPATERVTLQPTHLTPDATYTLALSNTLGQTLATTSLPNNATQHTLETELYPRGLYFVTLLQNGVPTYTQKLVLR